MNNSRSIAVILSSFFYVGYLPFMPGTFGSLAGLLIYYFIRNKPHYLILFTFIFTIIGFLAATRAEKIIGRKDAPQIVIDEVSGMLISLLFVPYDIKLVIIAFFLFRIFDTLKPMPIGKLQDLKGSLGVMLDDIVAGFYTNIAIQIVLRLTSFKTS